MTGLCQKIFRAMELKNLSPHTQRAYLAAVKGLARHYRQSPTAISKEMIEDYLLFFKKSQGLLQPPPGLLDQRLVAAGYHRRKVITLRSR
jgi:hypothetical protein